MNIPPIGFSLGSLFQISNKKISEESISLFRELECSALEINCYSPKELDYVLELPREIHECFTYCSLHAPFGKTIYRNDPETSSLISRIRQAHEYLHFDCICLHPDLIKDWTLIDAHSDLPWAVENMDCNKCSGQGVDELKALTSNHSVNMVLDLMHCYRLDRSMKLAKEMAAELRQQIVEIHLSGSHSNGFHATLFQTGQDEILIREAIELNVPIILEGVLESMDDVEKELEYCRGIMG